MASPGVAEIVYELLLTDLPLAERLNQVFGSPTDSMALVEQRALQLLPELKVIVWEGSAETFQFTYVSASAENVLGHSRHQWVNESTFWADVVVHPDDRNDAIAFCAVATGQGKDHDFEYRAVATDGRIVRLHDAVRVIKSARGIAERLRGVMIVKCDE